MNCMQTGQWGRKNTQAISMALCNHIKWQASTYSPNKRQHTDYNKSDSQGRNYKRITLEYPCQTNLLMLQENYTYYSISFKNLGITWRLVLSLLPLAIDHQLTNIQEAIEQSARSPSRRTKTILLHTELGRIAEASPMQATAIEAQSTMLIQKWCKQNKSGPAKENLIKPPIGATECTSQRHYQEMSKDHGTILKLVFNSIEIYIYKFTRKKW